MSVINNDLIADRTEAISRVPAKPGLISSMGFFKPRMSAQDNITFDIRDGSIKTLSDKLRSTADKNTVADREYAQHVLKIPHWPQSSLISRDNIAGIRAFDSEGQAQLASVIAEHLEDHAENIDLHLEHIQNKMLFDAKLVTDNYGTYDLAEEFGVQQGQKTLSYSQPGDTLKQFRELQNEGKAGLISGRSSGYVLFASEDLFEWLVANGDLVRAFELGMAGPNPLVNEMGDVGAGYQAINFGGTTIINYNDTFTLASGSKDSILAPGAGLFVPRTQVGKTFYGPENSMTGLSRGGARSFAKTIRDPRDRYVEVTSETNALPILESVGATIKVDFA
ncbi:major capsid protein [Halomonas sp. ATCH28]|uniref:Major capsid protein n=1 Tax=Halomonas gemina TaxID=2945105 RepID=A0ABT0T5V4_9GAMM|nr:major capsid protein [Halomonas gemina]MCL7942234.1 major capsid protein [Halomonas gemina]